MIINSDGSIERSFKESVCFDDVLLKPQYSDIESRTEIDIGNKLGGNRYRLPIIASPMDTVTEYKMALALSRNGGIGVVHRYNSIEEQSGIIGRLEMDPEVWTVAAAVGITGDYLERSQELVSHGADLLCIDVAHGHHILVKEALTNLRENLGNNVHIMAGNVATLDAFNDLANWGANSIRVGVGGGSICSTRVQTGHGMPTLQSVLDCAQSDRDALLIADGGIKTSGDIVKCLAAGADFVMLGSLLAATDESPGEVFTNTHGKQYKVYRGMASKEAQLAWRGSTSSMEGVSTTLPYKGPVGFILSELERGIRSGFSYTGARTIEELHAKAKFVRQTNASQVESSTHILRRN